MRELLILSSGVTVQVSDEDWDLAIKYQWSFGRYVQVTVDRKKVLKLHKLIAQRMGQDGEIDHKDRNRLNCQRENLRPATHQQNGANRSIGGNNKSGVKGVHWNSELRKWRASIRVAGKLIDLGCYDRIEDAQAAYAIASKKHFGDFATDGT